MRVFVSTSIGFTRGGNQFTSWKDPWTRMTYWLRAPLWKLLQITIDPNSHCISRLRGLAQIMDLKAWVISRCDDAGLAKMPRCGINSSHDNATSLETVSLSNHRGVSLVDTFPSTKPHRIPLRGIQLLGSRACSTTYALATIANLGFGWVGARIKIDTLIRVGPLRRLRSYMFVRAFTNYIEWHPSSYKLLWQYCYR